MDSKPAFPVPMITYPNGDSESVFDYGMTLREHAAITLRVPNSGDEQLDAMIRQANRRDAAVAAMQGLVHDLNLPKAMTSDRWADVAPTIAGVCVQLADALLAKLEESK